MDELGAPAEVVETPTETPAAPEAPVSAPTEPASSEPKTRADTIRDALNKPSNRGKHAAYQPREQGKFAPGSPNVPKEQAPEQPQAPSRPALLKSLKKELEPHWNAAPPELLQAFAQREADFEKGAETWKSKAAQADALLNEFQPYEWLLRQEGATPQNAIRPLLQTAALLRTGTPAQKAQAVAQTMQQFGVPLEHITAMFGHGEQSPVMDPNYNALAQQVQELRQYFAQTTQQQQAAQQQRAETVIQQFAADPANTHFAQVQDQMIALLQAPHLLGQDFHVLSERERLQRAYDAALRLDPNLSQQVIAQQQAELQRQQREKAQQAANVAKAAAVQVKGAPGAPLSPQVNPTDRASVIRNALRGMQ